MKTIKSIWKLALRVGNLCMCGASTMYLLLSANSLTGFFSVAIAAGFVAVLIDETIKSI